MQDYALARRAMVDCQLRPQGVTDVGVLGAMGRVPREDFVPANARAFAYYDRSIPVDDGRMIPPASLGRLLTAAAPRPGGRALVVSAAPGYAAALLRDIGIECVELPVAQFQKGVGVGGSFDVILIEGAVAAVPPSLSGALAAGGRLVTALIAPGGVARLAIGRRVGDVVGYVSFADSDLPPLPGFIHPPAFTF